ncbi:hypothetical protein Taro_005893, partial [Colocasia esculenta]|nr:hypothetical protein [Colocasia esculenta]
LRSPELPPSQPPLSLAAVARAPRRLTASHHRRRRCTPPLHAAAAASFFLSLSILFSLFLQICRDYTLPINVDNDEDDDDDPEFTAATRATRRSYVEEDERRRGLGTSGVFFNPRIQYKDNVHNDGEVMRGTMNVITRLVRTMDERLDAMVERYRMKLGIYGGYNMRCAVQRLTLGTGATGGYGLRGILSGYEDYSALPHQQQGS